MDIVDPDTLADAKKVLDLTLVKYRDKVSFLGAWFRHRPTAMPISFNDKDLAAFVKRPIRGNESLGPTCRTTKCCSIVTTSGGSRSDASSSMP